jgi:ATP-dependent DNA helicase RecQ
MSPIRPEPGPLRLDRLSYETLRQEVLCRDGWRCQSCGAMSNLEVHHKQFRSQSGDDSEENLITLCVACHNCVHSLRARKLRRNGEPND